jgi:hypothetical protein
MNQGQTNKEALFNEVKGSLFEFLLGRKIAQLNQAELIFIQGLDQNYLNVLSQQDRMVRQFYPEMLTFLNQMSQASVAALISFLKETPKSPQLMGKFINSSVADHLHEADLILETSKGILPLSLKLNKKNSFVNTKSGGIKSFFTQYFSFMDSTYQQDFNRLVDQEFIRMSIELHALNDMEFSGDYKEWVALGKSELPGELTPAERDILKRFYARMARQLHLILSMALEQDARSFAESLCPLMGFSQKDILQLICFHDFKTQGTQEILIHSFADVEEHLSEVRINEFRETSSVDLNLGPWNLQIRIKPMNKFTTTAIKINCSVKNQAARRPLETV